MVVPSNALPCEVNAHRGFSELAPENTLAALALAIEHETAGVEFDVRLSADGEVVLMHDETLRRTTNVAEVFPSRANDPVHTFTVAELAQLDAGSWKAPMFRNESVPTLADVVARFSGHPGHFYIELKHSDVMPEVFAKSVIDTISGRPGAIRPRGTGSVTVMSFDPSLIDAVKAASVDVRVGLVSDNPPNYSDLGNYHEFHLDHRMVSGPMVKQLQASGATVTCWTVDDGREARRCARAGVNSITTNRLTKIKAALAHQQPVALS